MPSPQSTIFGKAGTLCRLAAIAKGLLTDLARLEVHLWLVIDDVCELGSLPLRQLEPSLRAPGMLRFGSHRAGSRLDLRRLRYLN